MSLRQLAIDLGLTVEERPIPVEELESFEEVGACGTAAVISPICAIDDRDNNQIYTYCKDGNAGPISTKLYQKLQAIQFGDEPDIHGWVEVIE